MNKRVFADVEYKGRIYWDAEFIGETWYFEDGGGIFQPFFSQHDVKPRTAPKQQRTHPVHESGKVLPIS